MGAGAGHTIGGHARYRRVIDAELGFVKYYDS